MTNLAPRKWDYKESILNTYSVYEGDTTIAVVSEEKYLQLIADRKSTRLNSSH